MSSARAESIGRTSIPSAFAVLRFDNELEFGRLDDGQVRYFCAAKSRGCSQLAAEGFNALAPGRPAVLDGGLAFEARGK
jgi:hypothetical protein